MRKSRGKRTSLAARLAVRTMTRLRVSALSLLCALAMIVQCVFVMLDTHGAGEQGWAVAGAGTQIAADTRSDDSAAKPHQRHDNGLSTNCFLCQQMALAGAVILPETGSLSPMPAVVEDRLPYLADVKRVSAVSHSWLSRG